MSVELEKVAKSTIDLISEKIRNLKTLNIIVAGKTGVGKSTLINAVFKDQLAETGIGKPVTTHMRKISKNGIPLAIYDTKGFELGKDAQKEVKKEIIDTITTGLATKDINKTIHCIWYCINTTSSRVEPEEIEWIRSLTMENQVTQVPIIIVLTQSISKKKAEEIKRLIEEENLDVVQVIPVLAEEYELDEREPIKPFGLDKLLEVMGESLPEELLDTLQHVQIASLEEKKRRAHKIVATAATAAAGTGAAPIPFADATLLVPTQIGMIASITVVFGFDVNKSVIATLLSSALGTGGATILGRTVVTNLIKLIPGAGTVVGGAISAGTASVITIALGEAYIGIMELLFKGELSMSDISTEKGKSKMRELFTQQLKKQKT